MSQELHLRVLIVAFGRMSFNLLFPSRSKSVRIVAI